MGELWIDLLKINQIASTPNILNLFIYIADENSKIDIGAI